MDSVKQENEPNLQKVDGQNQKEDHDKKDYPQIKYEEYLYTFKSEFFIFQSFYYL